MSWHTSEALVREFGDSMGIGTQEQTQSVVLIQLVVFLHLTLHHHFDH